MDYKKLLIYCLLLLLALHSQAQSSADIIPEKRTVLIHKPDTLIELSILVNKSDKIELDEHKLYAWYAFDKIQVNQGAYAGQLLHGSYKVFNSNDQLIEQGHYQKGLKEGLWTTWDSKGLKAFECTYKGGLKEGVAYFFNNGKQTHQEQYKKGRLHGEVIHYLPDGKQEKSKYKEGTLVKYDESKAAKENLLTRWKNQRALNKQERLKDKEQKKLEREANKAQQKEKRQKKSKEKGAKVKETKQADSES
ncbi:hypothetical protein KDU71_05145 [Carboxylicivirga sediminis]|uniref:Toxin-antitoxin system YwqK family antitoxin n=1 Tax=Carboxylicivirga sediminis TaxID=2006564 RepID=A0A941F2I3_9BACT|nr:hypothetical protein [Carboxylicivirga sediminis]MBR8534938.1 hypothetical protein [Carboxylicivirga sediminis]